MKIEINTTVNGLSIKSKAPLEAVLTGGHTVTTWKPLETVFAGGHTVATWGPYTEDGLDAYMAARNLIQSITHDVAFYARKTNDELTIDAQGRKALLEQHFTVEPLPVYWGGK